MATVMLAQPTSYPQDGRRQSCTILFSGISYVRFKDGADCINFPVVRRSQHNSMQSKYVFPVIHDYFTTQKSEVIEYIGHDSS